VHRPAILALFVATRLALALAAVASPGYYERIDTDVNLYAGYAEQIVAEGRMPYVEVDVEYPPLLLPFLVAPAVLAPAVPYRVGWVILMVAVDAAGLLAVWRLGRRWGTAAGAWWWVALFPLLGPLVYTRFDLLPAVASVVALERAVAGRWSGTGAWLAAGTLAKLWPGFLVPSAVAVARRPWCVVAGGAADLLPAGVDSSGRVGL
jgi:hypothetical protein